MSDYDPSFACDIIEQHWSGQSSLPRSRGADAEEVAAFQTKYGVVLPDDFSAYISRLNGLAVAQDRNSWENVDAEGFEFYPLSSIDQAPESPGHYVFCRWSLGLLPFAIRLGVVGTPGEIVTLRGATGEPYFVASNFTLFAELYVENSSQLYECGQRVILVPES